VAAFVLVEVQIGVFKAGCKASLNAAEM
jgi:hypothetical protein